MTKHLTMASLFDGSGGFPLASMMAGIEPIWSSEIEPFPIRVTTKRMPSIKHYGDINNIDGTKVEPVDIITFGSPCQNLSIAGNRKGLSGSQSSLFHEAIRIIKQMRCKTNGEYPRYAVWENVPGAFSSNKGEDFKQVLQEFVNIKSETTVSKPEKWSHAGLIMADDFSIAWRVLDAQYWGVPQRRKRIFLVADFNGGSAGKILFESEGLSGYSTESFTAWQRATSNLENCARATGYDGYNGNLTDDKSSTLGVNCGMSTGRSSVITVYENHSQDTRYRELDDIAPTVSSTYGMGGNNQPFVVGDTPKTLKIRSGCEGGGKGALIQEDKSATLGTSNDQTVFVPTTLAISGTIIDRTDKSGPNGIGVSDDGKSYTLTSTDRHAVLYTLDRESVSCGFKFNRNLGISDNGINPTIKAVGPNSVAVPTYSANKASFFMNAEENKTGPLVATDYKDPPLVNTSYTVRRLTPTECARLQGFPDWWCDNLGSDSPTDEEIEFFTKVFEEHRNALKPETKPRTQKQITKWLQEPHNDGAEYKMWGNGVALPCVYFVMAGISYFAD